MSDAARQKSHKYPSPEPAFILWSKDTFKRSLSQPYSKLISPDLLTKVLSFQY